MDIDELRRMTADELVKLIRALKSTPVDDWDRELLRNVKQAYREKAACFEVRVGHSTAGQTYVL